MNPSRPQAPGYLANLMARLFHQISAEGLTPLGVRPAQFPILVDLWFGEGPATIVLSPLSAYGLFRTRSRATSRRRPMNGPTA